MTLLDEHGIPLKTINTSRGMVVMKCKDCGQPVIRIRGIKNPTCFECQKKRNRTINKRNPLA